MREKNARNAMNANKLLLAAALLLFSPSALAQAGGANQSQPGQKVYTAPSLYLLKEVFIDYPILTDPKVSSDCGLTRESMLTSLQRNLQDPGLDVMALNAVHAREGTRVNLAVEVMTVKQGKSCISWIDMPFSDKAPIMLPPVKVPRSLTLLFWQQKKVVSSSDDRHQATINDMLGTMVRQFLRDVKLAVPNELLGETYEGDIEEREKSLKNEARMKSLSDSVSQKLIMEQMAPEVPLAAPHEKKEP